MKLYDRHFPCMDVKLVQLSCILLVFIVWYQIKIETKSPVKSVSYSFFSIYPFYLKITKIKIKFVSPILIKKSVI